MDWHDADGSAPTKPVQGNAASLDHHFRSLIVETRTETRWCPFNRATLIQRTVNVADPPMPPDFAVIVAVPALSPVANPLALIADGAFLSRSQRRPANQRSDAASEIGASPGCTGNLEASLLLGGVRRPGGGPVNERRLM
jgi:hypothetical protein